LGVALAACSQSPTETSSLPMKFTLKCGEPIGSGEIPKEAKKGFDVVVDRSANRFSVPWWDKQPWPIAKVGPNEILLLNEHIDKGVDLNPEDRKISFDVRTGTLHYFEEYSALVPMRTEFSSKCEVENA
jgi:hypothetical protein